MYLGLLQLFIAMQGEGTTVPDSVEVDYTIIASLYSEQGVDFSLLPPHIRRLFELSVNAFSVIVHAWMSELPLEAQAIRLGQNILAAGGRHEAERIATDRGDLELLALQNAAYKTRHEIHRLMGLLRFSPDKEGVYIARCEPDHYILPALEPHFKARFGNTPWAIIDEKRRLCLCCEPGKPPALFVLDESPCEKAVQNGGDIWENMWRSYHTSINNTSRNNPGLQRQFMPKRYWKYLPEMDGNIS